MLESKQNLKLIDSKKRLEKKLRLKRRQEEKNRSLKRMLNMQLNWPLKSNKLRLS